MSATAAMTPREALDFYPTPHDVTHVLARWWTEKRPAGEVYPGPNLIDRFLDPAGGSGAIVEALRDFYPESHFSAIEIAESRFEAIDLMVENPIHGDALAIEWPDAHVVANPPFAMLDQFWQKATRHRSEFRRWCAVFTPVAWWNAEKRAAYERPDYILSLGWRPAFRDKAGPAHKGSQDFCWSLLAPNPEQRTTWQRVEKPTTTPAMRLL